jgi:hypothetical protein
MTDPTQWSEWVWSEQYQHKRKCEDSTGELDYDIQNTENHERIHKPSEVKESTKCLNLRRDTDLPKITEPVESSQAAIRRSWYIK